MPRPERHRRWPGPRPAGVLLAAVLLAAVPLAACGSDPSGPGPVSSGPAGPAPSAQALPAATTTHPAEVERSCGRARAAILRGTQAFTDGVRKVVSDGEAGHPERQDGDLAQLRAGLGHWAEELDSVAAATADASTRSVLVRYAGAVRAARDRVHQVGDLDALSSFDDIELDTAAEQFQRAC